MALHSPTQDDFWENGTDSMCATIEADHSIPDYDPEWLSAVQLSSHESDTRLMGSPPSTRYAEGEENPMEPRATPQRELPMVVKNPCLDKPIHIFTPDASLRHMSNPFFLDAGLNCLKFNVQSPQISGTLQNLMGGAEGVMKPHSMSFNEAITSVSSSRTRTPGLIRENDQIEMLRSIHATSPGPEDIVVPDVSKESVPAEMQASEGIRRTKRKLLFGMPTFINVERLKLPPSQKRRTSLSSEEHFFWQCINADALAPPQAEITFKDVQSTSKGDLQADNKTLRTPVLPDFDSPHLPLVGDNTDGSYPKCCDGFLVDIPRHHLKTLRKTIDPTFQNDEYWGDDLYFTEEPVNSLFCDQSTDYGFYKRDWSTIFHALENEVDQRIPLPDTETESRFSIEQLDRIWLNFKNGDRQQAIFEAQMPREWTEMQTDKAGLTWSVVRGRYFNDLLEFTTRSSRDICDSVEFKIFCSSARFIDGRPIVKPKGLPLSDTLAVLKYAGLHVASPRPVDRNDLQQTMQVPQHVVPADSSVLKRASISVGPGVSSYVSGSSTINTTQEPLEEPSQQRRQSIRVLTPTQNPMPLVHRAYHDIRVFMNLSQEHLIGIQRQWLQARAHQFTSQGWPVPNTLPTAQQVWQFFRQIVKAKETANRGQQTSREAAADEEGQASMLQNPFAQEPNTLMSSRPVQLQSHMPMKSGPLGGLQADSSRNMIASATLLGSPFLTPARLRNVNFDTRFS